MLRTWTFHYRPTVFTLRIAVTTPLRRVYTTVTRKSAALVSGKNKDRNTESSPRNAEPAWTLDEILAQCPCDLIPTMLREGALRSEEHLKAKLAWLENQVGSVSTISGRKLREPRGVSRPTKGRGPWPPVWTMRWHFDWCYRFLDHATETGNGPDHVRDRLRDSEWTPVGDTFDVHPDIPEPPPVLVLDEPQMAAALEVVQKAYDMRQTSADEYHRRKAGHVRRFLSELWGVKIPARRDPNHPEWAGDQPLPRVELVDDAWEKWADKVRRTAQQDGEDLDAWLLELARDAGFDAAQHTRDSRDQLDVLAQRISEMPEVKDPITSSGLLRKVAMRTAEQRGIKLKVSADLGAAILSTLQRLRRDARDNGWLPGTARAND